MKTFTFQVIAKRFAICILTFSLLYSNYSFAINNAPLSRNSAVLNNDSQSVSVIYASITASSTDKTVLINWKTSAETENNYFEVERSTDLQHFKTVAVVLDGFAAEGTGKSYGFKEAAGLLKNGKTVYYRLKQIDKNGTINYSPVMKIEQNKQFAIIAE